MRYLLLSTMACILTAASAQAETKALVKTTPIQTEKITKTITTYGNIEPDSSSFETISALHAAAVKRVFVRSGQKVGTGEKLIELENAPTERASYVQAKAASDFASQELARITRLYNEHLASNDQLSAAKRAAQEATSALAAKNKTGSNKAQEVITAPFAGIVANLKISPGDRIAADTVMLNITPSRGLVARLGINPEDAWRVAAGQAVALQSV